MVKTLNDLVNPNSQKLQKSCKSFTHLENLERHICTDAISKWFHHTGWIKPRWI